KAGSIVRSGEQGLWHARFADGSSLDASAFGAAGERLCSVKVDNATGLVTLSYTSPELDATIRLTATPQGLELRSEVTPHQKILLDFALPGRLRFAPADLQRFIAPMSSGQSVGIACNGNFFARQPQDKPSGWHSEQASGPASYSSLYGAPLDQRPDRDPPTTLTVTPEGSQWLGEALTKRLSGASAAVNRPPTRAQADLTLLDSPNGPYLSASHLGGAGYVWRVGGGVGPTERQNSLDAIGAVIERLAKAAPVERTKLGLIALRRGPDAGGWSDVTVEQWHTRLASAAKATGGKVELVLLASPEAMLQAAAASDFVAVLNPYGESAPATDAGMSATVAALGQYVRAGGNWFEVGGYPFYYALRPVRYLQINENYPPAFADFYHLQTSAGAAALYRMQPQKQPPWEGARNHDAIFIPGKLAFGGDEQGGYCDRAFATYVKPNETWQPPAVRVAIGNAVGADLAAYCEANAITRRLPDKVDPATLAKLRRSLLLYYAGTASEKLSGLSLLPTPSLIHFADYLHGGFDKQYPDHLPPSPAFGTPEETRTFFAQARQMGHLVMPYTNPTWWCDHPKGPTFEREGEAPLLKDLDGKPVYERYAQNDGWTVCHWHPAVQAANRQTVRQFTEEYPVDVLFQDQNGARGWGYDTNPASPTPYAYSEGLLSQVAEDCRTKPLSTEGGWDRVVNYETQLCGMTFSIVPTENSPSWTQRLTAEYPAETWTVFPLAQYIAHDKTIMVHHDLGQFVTNREMLSWTLGLGFGLSCRTSAAELSREPRRQWLLWLDRLQKSVCARYTGEPVKAFEHQRGPLGDSEGVMRARYGDVAITANLGAITRTEDNAALASHGFYATAPGLLAGNLQQVGGADGGPEGVCFVAEGGAKTGDLWVYAPAQQSVTVPAPPGMQGAVTLTLEGQAALKSAISKGTVSLTTPAKDGVRRVAPPADLAGKAPRDWPGAKPAVGVIDLGPGLGLAWTKIAPAAWVQALEQSSLAKSGLAVKRIGNYEQLQAALTAGPTQWLAIINPYGEGFPSAGPGKWRETLDAIHSYVNHGGVWWETGGHSFYRGVYPAAGGWEGDVVGPSGCGVLGVPVGYGEVEQPAERLTVTPQGQKWLSPELIAQVSATESIVNRAAPRGTEDPGHVALVSGGDQDYIAGYRLDGWGWLWRVGGMNPDEDLLPTVVAESLAHVYNTPPEPAVGGSTYYLWHAKLQAQ
ncbi:MAG: DUF6259 domain-containing protein, partial [Armatimonadota bacterium]